MSLTAAHEHPEASTGLMRCDDCGWGGVPNRARGGEQFCPRCGTDDWHTVADLYKNTGRNEPCPCGSGRKFKKCHGG